MLFCPGCHLCAPLTPILGRGRQGGGGSLTWRAFRGGFSPAPGRTWQKSSYTNCVPGHSLFSSPRIFSLRVACRCPLRKHCARQLRSPTAPPSRMETSSSSTRSAQPIMPIGVSSKGLLRTKTRIYFLEFYVLPHSFRSDSASGRLVGDTSEQQQEARAPSLSPPRDYYYS